MKRILTTICALLTIIAMLFSFTACSRYISSYSAIGLVRNSVGGKCGASFLALSGSLVLQISAPSGSEGDIKYTASLEEGSLDVYYDIYGTKESLFSISEGESLDSCGGYFEGGKAVYIIIEAKGARGSLEVSLED